MGLGLDVTQDEEAELLERLGLDKGHGRRQKVRDWDVTPEPVDFRRLSEFRKQKAAMVSRGWTESRIRKVLGENWVAFLREVWGE